MLRRTLLPVPAVRPKWSSTRPAPRRVLGDLQPRRAKSSNSSSSRDSGASIFDSLFSGAPPSQARPATKRKPDSAKEILKRVEARAVEGQDEQASADLKDEEETEVSIFKLLFRDAPGVPAQGEAPTGEETPQWTAEVTPLRNSELQTGDGEGSITSGNAVIKGETAAVMLPSSGMEGGMKTPLRQGTESERAVLRIHPLSKNLLESDFYRIGPQGKHVDGWSGSIRRIVQHRHPITFEPLSRYSLEFDTFADAEAYRDHVRRLRSKFMSRSFSSPGNRASGGTKAKDAFTLAPPSQRQVFYATGNTLRDILSEHELSDHDVLVSVDGRPLKPLGFKRLIAEDGRARNLAWALTDLRTLGLNGLTRPALPGGPGAAEGEPEAAGMGDGWDDFEALGLMAEKEQTKDKRAKTKTKKGWQRQANERVTRYVLSFASSAEAKRFARQWHRRMVGYPIKESLLNVSTLG